MRRPRRLRCTAPCSCTRTRACLSPCAASRQNRVGQRSSNFPGFHARRSIDFFFRLFSTSPSPFSLSLSLSLSGLCAFLSARCVLSHRSEYREGALDAMNHRTRVAVVAEVRHEGRLRSWKLNNDACIANTARCNRPVRQKRFSKAQYERRLVGRPEIMQM